MPSITKTHIFAFSLGLVPFVATMLFLNSNEISPEVSDKSEYIGCYGYDRKPVLEITDRAVRSVASKSSTKLKRILSVKGDAAINTQHEIIFDSIRNMIVIGKRDTGFLYVFKGDPPERSITVYD